MKLSWKIILQYKTKWKTPIRNNGMEKNNFFCAIVI